MATLRFSDALPNLIGDTARMTNRDISEIRPFVCNGSPLNCDVFVVGTNPASTVTWTPFWDRENEVFDKPGWLKIYEAERAEQKRSSGKTHFRTQSPTRSRIELLVNTIGGPSRVLETNLYAVSTPSGKNLKPADRVSLVFEFLLQTIKPKALFVHGDTAASYFRERYNLLHLGGSSRVSLAYGDCPVIFAPHLTARMGAVTNAGVVDWAQELKAAL